MTGRSLVVVCGPPGVGKSTVGRIVAERLEAEQLRTDVVRSDVVVDPSYTDDERRRVYHELFDRAESTLATGRSVVLDGTFQYESTRDRAARLADDAGATFDVVRVTCDEPTVRRRMAERRDDPSDAVFENYLTIRREFDGLECEHVRIDNSGSLERTAELVERRL